MKLAEPICDAVGLGLGLNSTQCVPKIWEAELGKELTGIRRRYRLGDDSGKANADVTRTGSRATTDLQ